MGALFVIMFAALCCAALPAVAQQAPSAVQAAQAPVFNWAQFLFTALPVLFTTATSIASYIVGQKAGAQGQSAQASQKATDKLTEVLGVVSMIAHGLTTLTLAVQAAQPATPSPVQQVAPPSDAPANAAPPEAAPPTPVA